MCGRYTLVVDQEELEERFEATFAEPFSPRYNLAPSQRLPVITDERPGTIRRIEWGLDPAWADDADGLINARAETIDRKPSFRDAYRRRRGGRSREDTGGPDGGPWAGRCLVLADGFYEWVETEHGKQPYRVAFADDRPFAMAGLWERRVPETTQTGLDAFGGGADVGGPADVRETFTVVTTEPNDAVADLHHRMAVVLEPDGERRWLTDDDPRELLAPIDGAEMRAYPVSTAVNDPAVDEPSLIEPVDGGVS